MMKIFTFEFPKDTVEVFKEIGETKSREIIIKEAAAHCGAKVDENRVNGDTRIMKVRCTNKTQETCIILKCSSYL